MQQQPPQGGNAPVISHVFSGIQGSTMPQTISRRKSMTTGMMWMQRCAKNGKNTVASRGTRGTLRTGPHLMWMPHESAIPANAPGCWIVEYWIFHDLPYHRVGGFAHVPFPSLLADSTLCDCFCALMRDVWEKKLRFCCVVVVVTLTKGQAVVVLQLHYWSSDLSLQKLICTGVDGRVSCRCCNALKCFKHSFSPFHLLTFVSTW